jgi:hypothetical protein
MSALTSSKLVTVGDNKGHSAVLSADMENGVLVLVVHSHTGRKVVIRVDPESGSVLSCGSEEEHRARVHKAAERLRGACPEVAE